MSRSKATEEEKAWQLGDQEISSQKRARRIADDLRAEANGKTCNGCKYAIVMSFGEGFCERHLNILTGNAIAILRPDATACRQWRRK